MANAALRERLFRDYAQSHQHPVNLALHRIAIPLIVFHILAMLDWIRIGPVSLAELACIAVVGWYVWLAGWRLGLPMAVGFGLLFPLARATPRSIVIVVAVFAWAAQLVGHAVFEKRRPSFLHNLAHALVGPAYFVAPLVGLPR
jgi:uncharacterized membrane protein YGL010W